MITIILTKKIVEANEFGVGSSYCPFFLLQTYSNIILGLRIEKNIYRINNIESIELLEILRRLTWPDDLFVNDSINADLIDIKTITKSLKNLFLNNGYKWSVSGLKCPKKFI